MPKISSRQISGQIGIIVILITAAVLTFGLSVANRVVQESKVTIDRSDSIRVFNVAETGVDEALSQIYRFEIGDLDFLPEGEDLLPLNNFSQVSIASSQTYEGYIGQGESLRIDLNNISGIINIQWSKSVCSDDHKVGLLLTLLHLSGGEYQSDYYLVGSSPDCLYSNQQNFINATEIGGTFKYSYNLEVNTALEDASLYVQTVGAGADLSVSAGVGLIRNATYEIESLAKSEDGESNKAIEVSKSLPSAPGFMTFALFSGGTIVK